VAARGGRGALRLHLDGCGFLHAPPMGRAIGSSSPRQWGVQVLIACACWLRIVAFVNSEWACENGRVRVARLVSARR